tara:strand:+ start:544 stop:1254 length:711 start_codon:yes stop_codon:yes gene_type:complete
VVGILAFKFEAIKKKSLLKSIKGITQKLCKQHDINMNDIGLIIHTGTYRQNFRQEPAFAAHLQQALKIGCDDVSSTSRHVFSFDVLDGSCGPHHALETIADLLPTMDCKYALFTAGDYRPNKETEWNHKPISFVAILSKDGPLEILGSNFDYNQQNDHTSTAILGKKYHLESFHSEPEITDHQIEDNLFIASSEWLSGEQASRFFEWAKSKNGILTHRIKNRNGRVSDLRWRVNVE